MITMTDETGRVWRMDTVEEAIALYREHKKSSWFKFKAAMGEYDKTQSSHSVPAPGQRDSTA